MTDFTSTPGKSSGEAEGSVFAPTPSWDRAKKRRGSRFGRTDRVAPEARSFAAEEPRPMTLSDDARAYETRTSRAAQLDPIDAPTGDFAVTPTYAERSATRTSSTAPMAIAAGVILLGGLAAAGWYYTQAQPQPAGIAQLTPGVSTTTTTVAPQVASNGPAPVEPAAPAATSPVQAAPPATAKPAPARPERPTAVARARTARTAADEGSNASSLAPALTAPAPTPPAATPPAPLVLNIPAAPTPPAQVSPAPTPPAEQPTTSPTEPPPT